MGLLNGFTTEKLNLNPLVLDTYLLESARRTGKAVAFLENPDDYIESITLGGKFEQKLMAQTLLSLRNIEAMHEAHKQAWLEGDEQKLLASGYFNQLDRFPEIRQKFINEPLARWILQIERNLKTAETEFFLFHLSYLLGPDGLIPKLKRAGFKVTRL